ncbi:MULTISPECIES: sugar ABC transporter substrate-binding protein [unclassified Methylobacterium]|uniref:ABC transporter substrate-binding protein n=1 Tax=unclassified Methylobacterium TaxID=2615210 RepID=UPI00226A64DF
MGIFRRHMLAMAALFPLLAAGPACAEPTTLTYWVAWDPLQAEAKAAQAAIVDFEAANPDIKVKTQVIAYDALHDKLVTALAGGDAPDITWGLSEWFGEFNKMGVLADLSAHAKTWPDLGALYSNVVQNLTIDGKLRALPNYLGLRALLYHADTLKAAGIAAPPKTWDELVQTSAAIQAKTGKPGFGIVGKGARAPQELLTYLGQNGVEIAKRMPDGKYRNTWAEAPEDLERATGVLALYGRLLSEKAIPPQSANWGWEEEDTNFALGQYAMVMNGSWMKGRIDQNPQTMRDVAVAPPPAGRTAATFFEIAPLYIFTGKHLDATWKFATFLLSRDVQTKVFPDRSPRSDVTGDPVWGKPFTDLVPIGIAFPPIVLGSIPRDMETALGRVLLKGEKPPAVAAWLAQAINKSLKRSGQLSE